MPLSKDLSSEKKWFPTISPLFLYAFHAKWNSIIITYLVGISEKFRMTFNKHRNLVQFTSSNTLRQKLVHPKDKTHRHKQSNVVHAVQCKTKTAKICTLGKQNNPYIVNANGTTVKSYLNNHFQLSLSAL